MESTLTATLPASHALIEVPILASEVAPPWDEPSLPSTGQLACIDAHPFVLSSRRTGRCLRRDPAIPDRAICGWPWARFPGAVLSSSITGMGCTKCASKTQKDATASSDSSSSAALSPDGSSGEPVCRLAVRTVSRETPCAFGRLKACTCMPWAVGWVSGIHICA